jgi:hypothetical protein
LRANEGDCLEICLSNLLGTVKSVTTVKASVHVQGLEVIDSLNDDGSWVELNDNGLASPATVFGLADSEQVIEQIDSVINGNNG